MELTLILSALFAVGIALAFLGVDLTITSRNNALEKRIDTYAPVAGTRQDQANQGGAGRIRSTRFGRQLQTELARADLPMTPAEYVLLNLLTILFGFLVGLYILASPLLALIGALLGLVSPRLYVLYLQSRRRRAFNSELPGALVLLSNTLRAGYGLSQAMETVSKEVAQPISVEFGRVNREVALGLPIQQALENLVRRNPSLDLELVVTAINVNHETGGNLSDVLDRIAGTVRDRIRIAAEIHTITSQQRMTAAILALLPPTVGLLVFVVNPSYIASLWESTCGLLLLGSGVILMSLGYLIIRRILAVKF